MGYILITGAGGFIGSHLLQYIRNTHPEQLNKVIILSNSTLSGLINIPHVNYIFSPEDFIKKGITDIEAVIHLGSFTPKDAMSKDLFDENYTNVTNTIFLLKNLPAQPKKFIYISTLDVYGVSKEVINEQTSILPASFYGQCKLFCEKAVIQFCLQHSIIPQVLRLGHIYGPGEEKYRKLIPETIRLLLRNKNPVVYGSGTEKRSYLYIADCVKGIWKSLQLNEYIGPVNITSAASITIHEVINLLIEISGKNVELNFINQGIKGPDIVFDNTKMVEFLCNESVNLKEGLRNTFLNFNLKDG